MEPIVTTISSDGNKMNRRWSAADWLIKQPTAAGRCLEFTQQHYSSPLNPS
jgi:hypothetical protein